MSEWWMDGVWEMLRFGSGSSGGIWFYLRKDFVGYRENVTLHNLGASSLLK